MTTCAPLFSIDLYKNTGWHGISNSITKQCIMKSLLIKTVSVVIFLLLFIKSWAAEIEPGTNDLPWFKQPWAWLVAVGIFAVLVFAYIKTGEKKSTSDPADDSL